MGRCWTWYTSIGGSTRPIPLSPGAKAFGASPVMRWTTYHCWVLLCALKFPLGKYVDRHPRGCGMGDMTSPMGPNSAKTHSALCPRYWPEGAHRELLAYGHVANQDRKSVV